MRRLPASAVQGRLVLFAAAFGCLAPAAHAQDLAAMQARMEAMEAQLRVQAEQLAAQSAEIAELKRGQAGNAVATAPAIAPVPEQQQLARAPSTATASENAPPAAPPELPAIASLPNGRPSWVSADGRFDASIYTIVQVDAGKYFQAKAGPITSDFRRDAAGGTANARDLNSGAVLRRARFGLEGKLFEDFDYNFSLELSGEDGARLNQGWVQYRGFAPLRIRVGSFGPNDELEGVSNKQALGMLEAAAVSDSTRGLQGGDGRFTAQLYGFGKRWFASTALTSGSVISAGDYYDDQASAFVRLAGRPLMWKDGWLHLGGHYSYSLQIADSGGPDAVGPRKTVQFRSRPEVRVDNTRLIGTGSIPAEHAYTAGVELALEHRNLTFEGEAISFGIDRPEPALADPHFFGWYVAGSWTLTGERRRYNLAGASIAEPGVRHPFDPRNGAWGSIELAAKYSVIDLDFHAGAPGARVPADGIRGGVQRTWSGGVNWYLNPSVRLMLGLQDVHILRLSPDPVLFKTPVGAQIGQRFQVVTMRSQLAF